MTSFSPERPTGFYPSRQFGFEYSLQHYLTYSPQDTRSGYVISARKQAGLLTVPPNGTVVELASGTGNSGLAFLEAIQGPIGRFIALDRSRNSIIAGRRFDQVTLKTWRRLLKPLPNITQQVKENIRRSRLRTLDFDTKSLVVQAQAQEIPLPTGLADGMFCVQGFHWFLFVDEDVAGNNPDYVLTSLKEMRRVLKPGAEFVFDTHGGAIDFGNQRWNSRLLNNLHFNRHPAHIAFVKALNRELRKAGFQTQIDSQRPNKYHQILNEQLMIQLLTRAGFEPIHLTGQSIYEVEPIQMDMEKFIQTRRHGGQMVYFTDPEISNLPEEEKARLLNKAADSFSKQDKETLSSQPAYEFLVFFKAKAV